MRNAWGVTEIDFASRAIFGNCDEYFNEFLLSQQFHDASDTGNVYINAYSSDTQVVELETGGIMCRSPLLSSPAVLWAEYSRHT
jgi:hypothetical protein